MLILIDNYDSFTFNLYHMLGHMLGHTLGHTLGEPAIQVIRNDHKTVDEIIALTPQAIILSPGPCRPKEAGICNDLVQAAAKHSIPLLGVCLGMQSIACSFGGTIRHAKNIMHGKTSSLRHQGGDMFADVPEIFEATRYHSLAIERETLPEMLTITAESCDDHEIMGLRHHHHPIWGVQFHPESIASHHGQKIIDNFIKLSEQISGKR